MKARQFVSNQQLLAWSGHVERGTFCFPTNERAPGAVESGTIRFPTNERDPGHVESGTIRFPVN